MFHTQNPAPGSPGDHLRHSELSGFISLQKVPCEALASIHSLRTKHQYKWGPLDVSWLITRMKTIVISTYKHHKP
jgi:hypothetical protein